MPGPKALRGRDFHTWLIRAAFVPVGGRAGRAAGAGLVCVLLSGCSGPQSALEPAGRDAARVAELFWWMAGGALVVWLIVIGLSIYAIRWKRRTYHPRQALFFIVGGGALFPTLTLTGLLIYGLSMLPDMLEPAPEGSLTIRVSGEQWWWRVFYEGSEGRSIELANEIRLPVGEPVNFILSSPDVVHAFWIPALGPKRDMVPGRETLLTLHPERTGRFRGVCAEYCGGSHALMAFDVVVMEAQAFADWLEAQAEPALPVADDSVESAGFELFRGTGCAACHTIRGTDAKGAIGPDLTHVGSRLSIGASLLENNPDGLARFIRQTGELKPEVHMPHFGMLPEDEIHALAAYLSSLK